jgi:predicted RNA-binding Zn-ribbon protein involved in translation (DUF1610 family)
MKGCGKSHDATHEHGSGNYWVCGKEGLCPSCAAALEAKVDPKGTPCPRCGQTDHGQYGEYPCPECGLPTLWGTTTSNPKDVDRAVYEEVVAERDALRAAILQTLDENGHLADGDDCTLIALKRAVGEP